MLNDTQKAISAFGNPDAGWLTLTVVVHEHEFFVRVSPKEVQLKIWV